MCVNKSCCSFKIQKNVFIVAPFFVRHGTKEKLVSADVSKSFTTETSEQENYYKEKKRLSTKRSLHNNAEDIGMEWTSKNKAFFLQNKFKTGNSF